MIDQRLKIKPIIFWRKIYFGKLIHLDVFCYATQREQPEHLWTWLCKKFVIINEQFSENYFFPKKYPTEIPNTLLFASDPSVVPGIRFVNPNS